MITTMQNPRLIQSPTWGVDLDGVLVNFNSGFLERVNAANGTAWKEHDVTDYHYSPLGMSREERIAHFDGMVEDGSYAKLAPLPFCHLMNLLPGNIHLITSRVKATHQATLDWLVQHEIHNWETLSFVVGQKSQMVVSGGVPDLDYFIEDCLDNVFDLAPFIRRKIFLIDQPYNQCEDLPANVERVTDWHQIINYFVFSKNQLLGRPEGAEG